jgi:hypothetical protein
MTMTTWKSNISCFFTPPLARWCLVSVLGLLCLLASLFFFFVIVASFGLDPFLWCTLLVSIYIFCLFIRLYKLGPVTLFLAPLLAWIFCYNSQRQTWKDLTQNENTLESSLIGTGRDKGKQIVINMNISTLN